MFCVWIKYPPPGIFYVDSFTLLAQILIISNQNVENILNLKLGVLLLIRNNLTQKKILVYECSLGQKIGGFK